MTPSTETVQTAVSQPCVGTATIGETLVDRVSRVLDEAAAMPPAKSGWRVRAQRTSPLTTRLVGR